MGLGVFGMHVCGFDVVTLLPAVVDRARTAGPGGALVFGLVYTVAIVAALPASVLSVGAGLLYGPLYGMAVVWPAAVTGATLSFLLGRTLLRDRIAQRIAKYPRFEALDRAMGEEGLQLVLWVRMSPLFPFGLLNYALGLTRIRLHAYVIATATGILPGTFLYVYLGSAGQAWAGSGQADTAHEAFFWFGLMATLGLAIVATRTARRALRQQLHPDAHEEVS
jgi:uncharacterized membrane protein YdjX (TVP38/TMEM64 family)